MTSYTEALDQGIDGMRIGVVEEGFTMRNADSDVNDKVRRAASLLSELGADVHKASLPMHAAGKAIWTPIALEGKLVITLLSMMCNLDLGLVLVRR